MLLDFWNAVSFGVESTKLASAVVHTVVGMWISSYGVTKAKP